VSGASFAERCGIDDAPRRAASAALPQALADAGIERVRISWCDLHGVQRGKTLMAGAVPGALRDGVGMVGTLLLKDSSDRTAYKVFEPGAADAPPGFGMACNLLLLPDPSSLQALPWAPGTAQLRAQPWFADATPVPLDSRRVLQQALARLAAAGCGLKCGLEVEFHIYRIEDQQARLDPLQAAWPGEPPRVSMVHPGYNLLADGWADLADEPLRIVQHTAQALGLPLRSLEIELGPSQVEAVFEATDALGAADQMVAFRNGVRQALQRAGYWATFMCRPPFANVMSSGWHLHQSVVDLHDGRNLCMRDAPAPGATALDAAFTLSDLGEHYLAGLLQHACGMSVFATCSVNGHARFGANALAPQAALWGRDNRGALLRVLGQCGDPATRIENRGGEPMANPYLYIASQVHAGLDGIERRLRAPPATLAPYAGTAARLPADLGAALDALHADSPLREALGLAFCDYYTRIKRSELQRHAAAPDPHEWQRREYFSRF
jgi:glutamine synthetase